MKSSKRTYARPRPRQAPGQMNKTEQRYEAEILKPLLMAGEILTYRFEGLKFRLAKKTFLTPDFYVVRGDCIEVHEVKGFWEDDARVKMKVAAELFPEFRWIAVQWKNKREGWVTEEF